MLDIFCVFIVFCVSWGERFVQILCLLFNWGVCLFIAELSPLLPRSSPSSGVKWQLPSATSHTHSEGPSRPLRVSKLPLLSHQECQEEELQRRLLDEQFAVLQGTATEAERILQDAVAKLDDPLHLRCTSSPGEAAGRALRPLGPCLSFVAWMGAQPTLREVALGLWGPWQAPPLTTSPRACRLPGEQGTGSSGRCECPGEGPCPVPELQVR